MYAIFSVKPEDKPKMDEAFKDDLVGRQSISVREAKVLGSERAGFLALIEGAEEAIKKARELFEEIGEEVKGGESKRIYDKFKSQESDVAEGVGLIFG